MTPTEIQADTCSGALRKQELWGRVGSFMGLAVGTWLAGLPVPALTVAWLIWLNLALQQLGALLKMQRGGHNKPALLTTLLAFAGTSWGLIAVFDMATLTGACLALGASLLYTLATAAGEVKKAPSLLPSHAQGVLMAFGCLCYGSSMGWLA